VYLFFSALSNFALHLAMAQIASSRMIFWLPASAAFYPRAVRAGLFALPSPHRLGNDVPFNRRRSLQVVCHVLSRLHELSRK
jgi:hypothetical protein